MKHNFHPAFYVFILLDVIYIPLSGMSAIPSRLMAIFSIAAILLIKLLSDKSVVLDKKIILQNLIYLALFIFAFRLWQNLEYFVLFIYLIFLPGVFISVDLPYNNKNYNKLLFTVMVVSLLFFILIPTYNHENIRILIGTDNNIWHGRLLGLIGLFIFFHFEDYPKIIKVLIASSIFILLLASEARGALIAYTIVIIANTVKLNRIVLITTVAAFPIVVFLMITLLQNQLELRSDYSNLERLKLFAFAFEGIISNPIFGGGPGSFEDNYWDPDIKYPHNIFLEIGYEYGIIGFIFLSIIALQITRNASRIDFGMFVYFLINASFSGNIFGNYQLLLMYMFVIQKRFRNFG